MTIIIAPDKFKGSLTAEEVCQAVREGLWEADPSLRIVSLPLADGGEGMSVLLTTFSGGASVTTPVRDPLFRNIQATYGLSRDGETAFIEMATASGLLLLTPEERNPLKTSSVGTGDLIRDALDRGVKHVVLGIGGSATNDAGMGAAEALGVKFFDEKGDQLRPVGESLACVHKVDTSSGHPRLQEISMTILCDVDNPLSGPQGAAFVFAPQKGADDAMVQKLDEGLQHYGQILEYQFHRSMNFAGAGAAGGLAVSLVAIAAVQIRRGTEFIMDFVGLEDQIRQADFVITGEGKIDRQTLSGKVVKGVTDQARRWAKPVLAVAGRCDLNSEELWALGVGQLVVLADDQTPDQEAMTQAYRLLKARVSMAWKARRSDKKS
jgi:glycerate kinase